MKTDHVEIFQTIRAQLQPYTANGFYAKVNSDKTYVLWTEQILSNENQKIELRCFAALEIAINGVILSLSSLQNNSDLLKLVPIELKTILNERNEFLITVLTDRLLTQLTDSIAIAFTNFKQKGWV